MRTVRQRQECCLEISKVPREIQPYGKASPETQSPMGKVAFWRTRQALYEMQKGIGKNIVSLSQTSF